MQTCRVSMAYKNHSIKDVVDAAELDAATKMVAGLGGLGFELYCCIGLGLGLDLHLQFEFRYSEHMHAAPASMM